MESFGRTILKRSNCKEMLLVCSVLLIVCNIMQQAQASEISMLARVDSKNAINPAISLLSLSNDYHVFLGGSVKIFCYCRNSSIPVQTMEVRINDTRIEHTQGCNLVVHTVTNTSLNNVGWYQCVAELHNGSLIRIPAGTLHVVDPNIINVPNVQYGLINTNGNLSSSVENHLHSTKWRNLQRDINLNSGTLFNVTLQHEGTYECVICLTTLNLVHRTLVNFTVIVPPTITTINSSSNFHSNKQETFVVEYNSKEHADTNVTWFKDDIVLHSETTTQQNKSAGKTQISFDPIRRSDKGEYHVVIENAHRIIPTDQSRAESRFTVNVTILPANLTRLNAENITNHSATLTWSATPNHADELADNYTITVNYMNKSLVHVVGGEVRRHPLILVPGEMHYVKVEANNQDGSVSSQHSFPALPGSPVVSAVQVQRNDSNSTVNLRVSLEYTGGGHIDHFIVNFRRPNTSRWERVGNFIAMATNNPLMWTAQVADERFQYSKVELQLAVVNSNGYTSNYISRIENIVLPGVPTQVEFVSANYDSALLNVVLPSVGTLPFTHLEVEFIDPEREVLNITVHSTYGELVKVSLLNLEDGKVYTISISIYNYGGKGMPSQHVQAFTASRPILPLHAIALVAVGGACLLVALVIIIVVIVKKYSSVKQRQRAYSVAEAEGTTFPSDHTIVKAGKSSPSSPISPTPPTPSTATSTLTGSRPSPPAFYPTPPGCSSSISFLPSGHTSTMTALNGSLPASSFKFDAGSSHCNSENQDSDISESNSPGYTYTFPRSGEGTPRIACAYEQVDLPFQVTPGALCGRLGVRACHVSHDPIRFSSESSRVVSASSRKISSSIVTESPHLRTQSTNSMGTGQTRLTSSDSASTKESLSYAHMISTTTDV